MNPMLQRAMGAYYTPNDASTWMAEWLISDGVTTILEPSSGDGSFVDAVLEVADLRGMAVQVHAVELDESVLAALATNPRVSKIHSDFHEVEPFAVDGVIGNPPFVRFRHLTDGSREAALATGTQAGIAVDSSGSTWMTFAVHAASFLRPGGRLALVLPADALHVRYARPFWSFMANRFGSLRVVRCRERIFPDLLQDVVLLLAYRAGSSTKVIESDLFASRADLTSSLRPSRTAVEVTAVVSGEKPFAKALLGEAYASSVQAFLDNTVRADTYTKFNIGYVAGDKSFFHPEETTQHEYQLPSRSLVPALRSGRQLSRAGVRTSSLPSSSVGTLWLPDKARLTKGEQRYIEWGQSMGVHTGYKTGRRRPWYVVPGVRVPDLLVPVFGELPKIMVNDSGLVTSNSLVAGYWKQAVDPDRFLLCWYSSVTRLGIELSVHALGGGVLVVIPGEADAIRMPALPAQPAPGELIERLDQALVDGDIQGAYAVGDAYLASAGWATEDLAATKEMADLLLSWRVDR
jgi:adenine-specific DNA-methyltransferase